MDDDSTAAKIRSLLGRIAGHVLLFTGALLTPASLWFVLNGRIGVLVVVAHLWGWLCFLAGLSLIYSN